MSGEVSGVGPVAALAEVGAAVAAAVGQVREGRLRGVGVDGLADTVERVRAAQAALEWVALAAVAELDVGGGHVLDGALTPAAWLRRRARMTPAEASTVVRTARALTGHGSAGQALAGTGLALAEGRIDPGHARVIARGAADAPAGAVALIEPHLLEVAGSDHPGAVAAVLRRFAETLDPDAADAAAVRRYDQRGLSATTTLDGMLVGRFLLDPAAGSALLTALDAADPPVSGERRRPAQRRADALAAVVGHFLASADLPRTAGARPHVILTDTQGNGAAAESSGWECPSTQELVGATRAALAAALQAALEGDGPRLSWIGPVPPGTAERVACDAGLTAARIDPDGSATISRRRRCFTWTQRLAIIARDGDRCAWPYCDRPIWWVDAHHVRPYQHGGPTTVANGAMLCTGHHILVHEGRWSVRRGTDGRYTAHHRDRGTVGPEPHRRPPGRRPPTVLRE